MNATAQRRAYLDVTLAYWAFMLTDGALRLAVLLHFHERGVGPIELALLFLVYEAMGIVTNLGAGWLGTRFGLASTLYGGLTLQIAALSLLLPTASAPVGDTTAWLVWVMAVQGLSGVAKDLTKTSAKSAVKALIVDHDGALFRWVARLTGSKNAVKGLGFFVGAALLATLGFTGTLLTLAGSLLVVLAYLAVAERAPLGARRASARIGDVRSTDPAIDRLSIARLFLFASRDAWFVVGVPVFLHRTLTASVDVNAREAFLLVGAFMALWVIGYGGVQTIAPKWLASARESPGAALAAARRWSGALVATLLPLAAVALASGSVSNDIDAVRTAPIAVLALVVGLFVYGTVFALNSALHSYLILALTSEERATLDVGFYYSANAGGRLVGTLASGIAYGTFGLAGCLGAATLLAALAWHASHRLHQPGNGGAPGRRPP